MATITTLRSGDDSNTAVWSTGTVPVEGDKVTISKLGTATSRTLSAGIASGATSIPVSAGTGTIVVGEVIQFDGDPDYYEVTGPGAVGANALSTSAASITISPGVSSARSSGAVIRNRGHKVRLTANRTWGDDTTSAITVNGVLYWTRANDATLTSKGSYSVGATGTEDRGQNTDRCDTYLAGLLLNYSATLAAAKYGASYPAGARHFVYGKTRKRLTQQTSSVAAAGTSVNVADATGWTIGDKLVFLPTALASPAQIDEVTVTGVAGNTISFSGGITNAHALNGYVMNMTSNVFTRDYNTSFGHSAITWNASSGGLGYDKSLINGEWTCNLTTFVQQYTIVASTAAGQQTQARVSGSSFSTSASWTTLSTSAVAQEMPFTDSNAYNRTNGIALAPVNIALDGGASVSKSAQYLGGTSSASICMGTARNAVFCSGVSFANGGGFLSFGGSMSNCTVVPSLPSAQGQTPFAVSAAGVSVSGVNIAPFGLSSGAACVAFSGGANKLNSCTYGAVSANPSYGAFRGSSLESWFGNYYGGASNVHEAWINEGYYVSATDQIKAGTASLKMQNKVAGLPLTRSFVSSIGPNTSRTLKINIRRDSAYGAGSMPTVSISGGDATVTTAVADVADAWQTATLTVVNSTAATKQLTVTYTASGAVGGSCWFDGAADFPYVQVARWYGFNFDEANPFRVVDPTLTLSEPAAAAITGITINHTTQTISVSGAYSAAEVYCYAVWDLCQTANLTKPRHIVSSDGVSFTTTYEVFLNSAGDISGTYTDALGVHTAVTATLPAAGCRVQLYNVTQNYEVTNQTVSGTAFSYPMLYDTYSAGNVLRLRVAYVSGATAKLPQEVFATLTESGATFTVPDADDTVYASNGVDGSTCDVSGGGEFTADYPNLQIDVSDTDGVTSVQRVYAWSVWANTTAQGVRLMFGAVQAADTLNYVIDQAVVDAKFDNVNSDPVQIIGGYIRRADGSTVIATTSGSIQMDPGRAYLAGGASIAADVWASPTRTLTDGAAANVLAIKAKTDNLPAAPAAVGDIPTASANATAVRANLTTELARIDVATSTRLADASYTAPDNAGVAAVKAKTDNLPSDPADASDIAAAFSTVDGHVLAVKAQTDQLAFSGGHVQADLRSIAAAPVAVDTGTAGTVSFVSGAYVATEGGTVQANVVQIDGENVASDGSGRIRIDTAENADRLLGRSLAGGADGGRTVRDALRASRNKSHLVGGVLTVYQEDDATPAWTADVTTASRDPVSGIDPT